MTATKKIVNPGSIEGHRVFIEIVPEQKEKGLCLSIHGVVGPKHNGDCWGSCGQCLDSLREMDRLSDGWTAEMVEKLYSIWDTWHLNDMNAACEHQSKLWDTSEEIEVQTYTQVGTMYDDIEAVVRMGRATKKEKDLLVLSDEVYHELIMGRSTEYRKADIEKLIASNMLAPWKTEKKNAGWVNPSQHPKGLLGKPCPVCGYKYGSAWLFREVPADVLEWLAALPNTTVTPAWV